MSYFLPTVTEYKHDFKNSVEGDKTKDKKSAMSTRNLRLPWWRQEFPLTSPTIDTQIKGF